MTFKNQISRLREVLSELDDILYGLSDIGTDAASDASKEIDSAMDCLEDAVKIMM